MFHKLTAIALALLIGSPMCWCGWMHQQSAKAAPALPACCHAKDKSAQSSKTSSKPKEDCPCAQAPKAREIVSSKISVPSGKVIGFDWQVWASQEMAAILPSHYRVAGDWLFWRGPPRPSEPLYLVQCSLLI